MIPLRVAMKAVVSHAFEVASKDFASKQGCGDTSWTDLDNAMWAMQGLAGLDDKDLAPFEKIGVGFWVVELAKKHKALATKSRA